MPTKTKRYSLDELMSRLPLERRERIEKRAQRTLRSMRLQELREARQFSQVALAKKLKVEQPAVAKMEKRADMYISTLRHYIRATGGELQILAKYPEGNVEIRNFSGV